jgi:hypothetical protein
MTEPKPVYVIEQNDGELTAVDPPASDFQAPGAEPRITAQFPYDPSLRILADDLRIVCGYSGATNIAILRVIVAPTLEWNHDGRHASLNLADAGTLILIRFPGHDGGLPAEHFNLAPASA